MKWKPSESAAANARRALPKLAEKYFRAGRKAADGKVSPKALHQFRITTKKFRYALELFRPVYGASLERRLKSLRELQDVLGKINDHQTVLEMLAQDKELEAKLERSIKRNSKHFRKIWKAFDADGEFQQWKKYLNREQRRPPASARPRQRRRAS
jgi:CHAD domain-containing protein